MLFTFLPSRRHFHQVGKVPTAGASSQLMLASFCGHSYLYTKMLPPTLSPSLEHKPFTFRALLPTLSIPRLPSGSQSAVHSVSKDFGDDRDVDLDEEEGENVRNCMSHVGRKQR